MIFVSYSWKDKSKVLDIVNKIRKQGHQVWVDYENLDLNKPLEGQILRAIENCDQFLQIISKNSEKSKWVAFERRFAKILKNKNQIKRLYLTQIGQA